MTHRLFNILIALVLTACSGTGHKAPIDDRKPPELDRINHHLVTKSETLFSIAWRYGIDYKTLAARNTIGSPYVIYPGQKLSLWKSIPSTVKTRVRNPSVKKYKPVPAKIVKKSTKPSPKKVIKKAPAKVAKITNRSRTKTPARVGPSKVQSQQSMGKWRWPAKGKLLVRFSGARGLKRGVDIGGVLGESVIAAAAGKVVYAGSGLRGYGQLIIVKHNDMFLSAYGHNKKLRVKEGEYVKGGQRIADKGNSGADRVKLHFEIRKNGVPVDPLKYLPRR